jgi:ABC-2 type transport system permease protein
LLRAILAAKWGALKSQIQYPVDFALHVIGIGFIGIVEALSILVLTNTFGSIGGWSFWEIGFMGSLWRMAHGVHHIFFIPFWWQGRLVKNGEFDRMLVRPVHPIFQIMTQGHSLPAIGELLPAIALFAITCPRVVVEWNLFNILFLLIVIFSSSIIEWAVFLFFSAFDFWLIETSNLRGIPGPFLWQVTKYPIHIYGRVFPFVITFVFPYAFMAYYPTHYFFQRDVEIFHDFFTYITPLVAVVALAIGYAFWSVGLKHYQSTGS